MCVMDIRLAAQVEMKSEPITTDAAGFAVLPDLSRALWFYVLDNAGLSAHVYFRDNSGSDRLLPSDETIKFGTLTLWAYSSRLFGQSITGRIRTFFTASTVGRVVWAELPIPAFTETIQPVG